MKKEVLSKMFLLFVWAGCFFASCSNDEEEETFLREPTVSFNHETGIYTVKIGRKTTLEAVVEDAVKPVYTWKQEGIIVGTELSYVFEGKKLGSTYLTFRVDAKNGTVEEEVRVDVVEKTPPVVSLPIPEGRVTAYAGKDLRLAPVVLNHDGALYSWVLDGTEVGTDSVFVFNRTEERDYELLLVVKNDDGEDQVKATIRVLPVPEFSVSFSEPEIRVPQGRPVYLKPDVSSVDDKIDYRWEVDGTFQIGMNDGLFIYTPEEVGKTTEIKVTATVGEKKFSAVVRVVCIAKEGTYYRPSTATSSLDFNKVYDFLPAPGQFVGQCTAVTQEQANAWAESRMSSGGYVSLGGFGGYVVVGFDHSIDNHENDYDFGIEGNSFSGSSEPGIVWVMQDENGDGLPNDTWYELKGCEYGKPETRQDYVLTYYKPKSAGMPVAWTDTLGNSGTLDTNPAYPSWISAGSYQLRGTCLKGRNSQDASTGNWVNTDYDWGYADNYGSDLLSPEVYPEARKGYNYFKIENAVSVSGVPVDLQYVDFIKIQVGVHAQSGWLGEISTEVLNVTDYKTSK